MPAGLQSVELELGENTVNLEIADNDAERSKGLSNRSELEEGSGMLFAYSKPAKPCFWMRETLIPLDAAFINHGGKIVMIATMEPESLDLHCVEEPIKWVIEMEAGWFGEHGLGVGSEVEKNTLARLRGISVAAAVAW